MKLLYFLSERVFVVEACMHHCVFCCVRCYFGPASAYRRNRVLNFGKYDQ